MKKAIITKIAIYSVVAVFLLGALIFGLNTGFGLKALKQEETKTPYKASYEYTAKTEDLHNLDVSWVSGKIEIKLYEGDVVKITETAPAKLGENAKLSLESDDETLHIRWNDKTNWIFGLSLFHKGESKNLVIEIPRAMELYKVKVDAASAGISGADLVANSISLKTASGKITATNFIAKEVKLDAVSGGFQAEKILCEKAVLHTVSGDSTAKGITADELHADSVVGAIDLDGNLLAADVSSILGNVTVHSGILPKKSAISTISGKLLLTLPENDGFVLEKTTVSGNFVSTTLPLETKGKETYYKDQKSKNTVKLSTTSGAMKLEKSTAAEKPLTYGGWLQEQLAAKAPTENQE